MNDRGMEIWELAIRESVRQTLADYTAGTDRNRIEDVAACFAPDGVAHVHRRGTDGRTRGDRGGAQRAGGPFRGGIRCR